MEYKYDSAVPLSFKGKIIQRNDIVELTEEELNKLPKWRFKEVKRRSKKEVDKNGQNMEG